MTTNMIKLWFSPWEAARAAADLWETTIATQFVLGARLPIIAAATTDPLAADHRELSLMVTEKVDAFGKAGRSVVRASTAVQRAGDANARDWERIVTGKLLTPIDWMAIFERNLMIATTIMTMPAQALAPIHKGVTVNARRLRKG